MAKLKDLLRGVTVREQRGTMQVEIGDITCDSRRVKPGGLFVAIPGHELDGHQFIPDALKRGARALMVGRIALGQIALTQPQGENIPQVVVDNPREALADVAVRFFGDPSKRLRVIGITGTNGKTTLTYLLEAILTEAGHSVAVMGTINYRFAGQIFHAPTTTAESVELQRFFYEVLSQGGTDVVMEVSSHALSQGRVRGVQFDAAVFTNLTQDHLDYHRDMDDYFETKARLFTEFLRESRKKKKIAVINGDDPRAAELAGKYRGAVVKTGLAAEFDIKPLAYELTTAGVTLEVRLGKQSVRVRSPLMGRFNLENILLAVGVAHHLRIPAETIVRGIARLSGVPGRLERIPNGKGIDVFVDYAHTPDALKRVGDELRRLTQGRPELGKPDSGKLITVFGCGGDRDRTKRALMGREAASFSDSIILTSDNPRTEDPLQILDDIAQGVRAAHFLQEHFKVVPDRASALCEALRMAGKGDTLLVAGKGHEDYQIIGTKKNHFSDQEVLRKLLGS